MSVDINHYVGYYYKCVPKDKKQVSVDFADESFWRIYDEGGCPEINDVHIYIPNKKCGGCHYLDSHTTTGLLESENMSEWIVDAEKVFIEHYGSENVQFTYGIITYAH